MGLKIKHFNRAMKGQEEREKFADFKLTKATADEATFEFEDNNGVMNIIFENGSSKFVLTPNTPVRQIWISAQATSFKLEWSEAAQAFVLAKSGEDLKTLTQRLLREHLADPTMTLP